MDGNSSDPSELDRPRFTELARGYESFYLRACAPEGGLGVWLRYTVHRPAGAAPTGSLWLTLFDAEAPGPVAAKLTVPDPESGDGDWLRVAGGRIGPGVASGRLHLPSGPEASWELSFTGEEPLAHLSSARLYRSRLPRTKPVSLHPVARFDGTVTVAGRRIELAGWPGMVGHNWGTQHAERWIWLHGMGFTGEPDSTWLDVVFARVRVAGRRTPWLASGAISLAGQRIALGGPSRFRRTSVHEEPDRLRFGLLGRGIEVAGTVRAPRNRFVGWVYADPDGTAHDTVNCSIADLEVSVSRRNARPLVLTAPGLATYELGMREHDHGMTIQEFPDG